MNSEELIGFLVTHQEALVTCLADDGVSADEREEVVAALGEVRDAVTEGRPAGSAVRRLRRALAVLPEDSPLSDVLTGHRYAVTGTGAPSVPSAEALTSLLTGLSAGLSAGPRGGPAAGAAKGVAEEPAGLGPEELLARSRDQLLAAPALTEREHDEFLAGHGPDPALIRLRPPRSRPDSPPRCPRFQFRPGTLEPVPVVLRVNRLLRADLDPWGAADWWLGRNTWLQGVPADLLGVLPDEEIEVAALELVEAG
ncbi:hypothetical protein [Streptomyces sp. UH6]|uniref:hypothetical protein n=1 Tax=Streptomyces sp. UH6 TaxID=2748379 RepID=UPI0015D4B9FC|nr:hypothetical protein [Streptomyces sp. UH6]NYV77371.1 hypothetical protein [Streptomyces sp. UH6]